MQFFGPLTVNLTEDDLVNIHAVCPDEFDIKDPLGISNDLVECLREHREAHEELSDLILSGGGFDGDFAMEDLRPTFIATWHRWGWEGSFISPRLWEAVDPRQQRPAATPEALAASQKKTA